MSTATGREYRMSADRGGGRLCGSAGLGGQPSTTARCPVVTDKARRLSQEVEKCFVAVERRTGGIPEGPRRLSYGRA